MRVLRNSFLFSLVLIAPGLVGLGTNAHAKYWNKNQLQKMFSASVISITEDGTVEVNGLVPEACHEHLKNFKIEVVDIDADFDKESCKGTALAIAISDESAATLSRTSTALIDCLKENGNQRLASKFRKKALSTGTNLSEFFEGARLLETGHVSIAVDHSSGSKIKCEKLTDEYVTPEDHERRENEQREQIAAEREAKAAEAQEKRQKERRGIIDQNHDVIATCEVKGNFDEARKAVEILSEMDEISSFQAREKLDEIRKKERQAQILTLESEISTLTSPDLAAVSRIREGILEWSSEFRHSYSRQHASDRKRAAVALINLANKLCPIDAGTSASCNKAIEMVEKDAFSFGEANKTEFESKVFELKISKLYAEARTEAMPPQLLHVKQASLMHEWQIRRHRVCEANSSQSDACTDTLKQRAAIMQASHVAQQALTARQQQQIAEANLMNGGGTSTQMHQDPMAMQHQMMMQQQMQMMAMMNQNPQMQAALLQQNPALFQTPGMQPGMGMPQPFGYPPMGGFPPVGAYPQGLGYGFQPGFSPYGAGFGSPYGMGMPQMPYSVFPPTQGMGMNGYVQGGFGANQFGYNPYATGMQPGMGMGFGMPGMIR